MKEVKEQGLSPRQRGALQMVFSHSHALCERDGVFPGDEGYKKMLTQYGRCLDNASYSEAQQAGIGPSYDVTLRSLVRRGLLKNYLQVVFLTKQGIALLEKYPVRVRK
tara:strand:- start:10580 stop:10903 length:324 start_codon:yes stop_codon:yes gene_type:complete